MTTDFDFYTGTWAVANRRLRNPLTGSTDWYEFPAVSTAHGFFGGMGNFDEIEFPTLGWSGATVRTWRPDTEQWSIHWISSRDPFLDQPVVGRFVDGVGEFYCDETYTGEGHVDTPVRVRFLWKDITATSARWEQAFSLDGGETWETNWTMDSTRTS